MSEDKPTRFEPIAVSAESTVVAKYVPESASTVTPPGSTGAENGRQNPAADIMVPAPTTTSKRLPIKDLSLVPGAPARRPSR